MTDTPTPATPAEEIDLEAEEALVAADVADGEDVPDTSDGVDQTAAPTPGAPA